MKKGNVAWIGVGVMGASQAGHLVKDGWAVKAYGHHYEKVAAKAPDFGFTPCRTIAEAVADADFVFVMVGYPADVEEVFCTEGGILASARPGTVVVDMTTSSPTLAQKLYALGKEKGIPVLDAPVSGGDKGAREATLSIMVGGDEEAFNKAQPSLIRTEADELTYCLHIMVRYEIEKQLVGGALDVKDVPATWNRLYKEYLGVDVPDDKHGCLQDSHWSGGSFGYFPSYALGSAYGAQMLRNMEREFDVWGPVSRGDLSQVSAWLRDKVHQYGGLLTPAEVVRNACGDFDPAVYTDYLIGKYSKLYEL